MVAFRRDGTIDVRQRLVAPVVVVAQTWPDPDVIARAADLLRALAEASTRLTDALDVAGFPAGERGSDVALLSTLATGMPPVTVDEIVDALHHLAVTSGPGALFPDAFPELSLPDEAHELLYIVEPLGVLAGGRGRLPWYAGQPLRSSPLAFSITQAPVRVAFAEVDAILHEIEALPLSRQALTIIRRSRHRRPEPTRAAALILLGTFLLVVLAVLAAITLVTGSLPFDLRSLLP